MISISQVQLVAHSNNAETTLDFCRKSKTELIILEVRAEDRECMKSVPEIKALCPEGHVAALIHDEIERRLAEEVEADLVLSIGTRASKLKVRIEELARTSVEKSR